MNSLRAVTRRAALAAFLLFAAAVFVVGPADASRTTTDARSSLASISAPSLALSSSRELASLELPMLELPLLEPPASADISPRFGFAEDLGLLDPEAGPGGIVVFAVEAAQCALTYARNNPLKYVDPDGRAWKIPEAVTSNYGRNFAFRASVYATLLSAGPAGEGAAVLADSVLKLALPSSNGEVTENFSTALMGMAAGVDVPAGEFLRVATAGKAAFQLKKGELGISVFERGAVNPSLTDAEVLGAFRPGSKVVSRTAGEIRATGLSIESTAGHPSLPPRLLQAHREIVPTENMLRVDFKKALKSLEDP